MTYAHLNYIDIRLNNGTIINQGDLIGLSGLTGNAKKGFSPHVHIQIKVNGKSENPENVLYTKYDNTILFFLSLLYNYVNNIELRAYVC